MAQRIVLTFEESKITSIVLDANSHKVVTEGGCLKVMADGKPVVIIPNERVKFCQLQDIPEESPLVVPPGAGEVS